MTKKWIITIVFAGFIGVNTSCSNSNESSKNTSQPSSYHIMSAVFIGTPSQVTIKSALEPVMSFYNVDVNEANLKTCADVLVALRKSSDIKVTEMEILNYMSKSKMEKVSFGEAAAYAFTFLTMEKQ